MSLRLEISATPLRWEQQSSPAQLNLSTVMPKVEIDNTAARVEISGNKMGELSIDTTAARAALGLKNFTQFTQDFADQAMQNIADAIGKLASDGDRMMEFQSGNAIVDLATESAMPVETSIEWGYKPGPEVNYYPNELQVQLVRGQADIQLRRGTVNNDTRFPNSHLQVTQYARVDINVVGSRTDQQI